jgi:hypothetical protein
MHRRSARWTSLAIAALIPLLAACGGDSGGGDGATSTAASTTTDGSSTSDGGGQPSASNDGSECTVTLAGDRDDTWTFPQAATSFSTDYWFSEEDLEETIDFLGTAADGTYDEIVERGDPIITFLQISCSDPDNLVQGALVTHTNTTVVSDIPMAPGSYPISGGLFDADGPAGTFIASLSVDDEVLYGTVDGSGSLEITRWDLEAIEGSFTFEVREAFAEDDPEEITVRVDFSFVCRDWFSGC